MNIDAKTYVALSVAMFLEYAIWGAWAPVLAARLLGPLKMTGKQTGWIYATLPIACIFAPFAAGWIADRWLNAEWVLIGAHLVGVVLLFLAARQSKFAPLFLVMLCYSLCYGATLPLVNAVLFAATSDGATQAKVFIWAPIAWALVGWVLTGWRMTRKEQGDGSDCLYFAAGLSVLMVLGCVYLSIVAPCPPAKAAEEIPIVGMMAMLGYFDFLIFLLVSIVVFGLMQFYFLGTAQFMQDMGIASKHVPASMAIAQIAQALATLFLFSWFQAHAGFKGTLAFGAVCWLLLYHFYVSGKPQWLIVAAQPLHGLAYVCFVIVGQVFTDVFTVSVGRADIRSSMQALIFSATAGVGLFLGTQFAGIVMDTHAENGKFQWSKVWAVPAAVMLAGVLTLLAMFHDPAPAKLPAAPPAAAAEQT